MHTRMDKNGEFIQFLADEYYLGILRLTSRKECSAMQLSRELNIPASTVYNKLKLLEEAEIIQNVKTLIDRAGNHVKYYRSTVRDATIEFHEGEILTNIK